MKSLIYPFVSCLFLFLWSCSEDEPEATPPSASSKELLSFSFLAEHNPERVAEDLTYKVYDNHVNAMFPVGQTHDSLAASFSTTANEVRVDTAVQESGVTRHDFTQPVNYTLLAEDGSTATYEIRGHTYSGIPVVYINTEGEAPIVSRDEYIDGDITIIVNGQGEESIDQEEIEIRGRGNSSWQLPKKPYRFRFSDRTEVLGMPEHKVWVLLANFSDKTLLRNHLAFEMSRRFGLAYTPRSEFVDLYLNGTYQGNYQLTEQIRIDESRLAIDELEEEDTDPEAITGGYLLEIDERSDPDPAFVTTQGVHFKIKSPDEGPAEQLSYIQDYVQTTEDVLFSETFADPEQGYAQYLDVASFIDWYLVNEISKNNDARFFSSVYLHKPRGGKLTMGPVWDFDLGFGNVDYSDSEFPEGWRIRNASWYQRLFEDPAFEQQVRDRWQALRPDIETLAEQIDQDAAFLAQSQQLNFGTWDILNKRVWPNPVVTGSYEGEVAYLKDWLDQRIDWMDSQLGQ